jgi:hypothetical protein
MYYDRSGNPISLEGWAFLFEQDRSVAVDKISAGEYVSTVWLGLDHSLSYITDNPLPPLIFETMIFGGPYNEYMFRYSTEEEAKEGHERIVRERKLGADPTFSRDLA